MSTPTCSVVTYYYDTKLCELCQNCFSIGDVDDFNLITSGIDCGVNGGECEVGWN